MSNLINEENLSDCPADALSEIQEAMQVLLCLAKEQMGNAQQSLEDSGIIDCTWRHRAEGYWLAQMTTALSNDHGYLNDAAVTMEQTVEELTTLF